MDYIQSPFQEFESYLKILTGLKEDDIQLILRQYNSKCITDKFSPGDYTINDSSEFLSRGFKNEFEIRGGVRPNQKYDKRDSIIIDDKFP